MFKLFKYFILLSVISLNTCAYAEYFYGYEDYVYDANDFATDWIEYYHNGMYYDWLSGLAMDKPENVFGRPTVDTTGDDWYIPEDEPIPVNPVYPAFRAHELVFLGEGGFIVLKFNHPVRDDENNPYGIDFIVFGNAFQVIGGGQGWVNGDPAFTTVGPDGFIEPGIVSVSQNGITWYSFTNNISFMAGNPYFIKFIDDPNDGPFCDSFAPTLGRVYMDDPNLADPNLGQWNQWWSEPTNPTLPIDPTLWFDSFSGYSVAEICEVYGHSAGGTGYDISRLDLPMDPATGKKWFQYVRVDDKAGGGNAEIDAFSDVSCCGDWKHPFPAGDLNRDCRVDMADLSVLSQRWMDEFEGQGMAELVILAENWLRCSWDCNH
jgi:hypothetical protein